MTHPRIGSFPQRLMLALVLEITILAVMGKDMFSFNGEGDVRLQLVGGPIGLKLSGVLAKVYMLYWSRHFQNIITRVTRNSNFMLYLCKLYVDDNNLAMEELEPGSRFIDGELVVVQDEVEDDSCIPGDQRTAKVVQTIANSISPFIKMTVDCPSLHQDGWMPILDLQVKVSDIKPTPLTSNTTGTPCQIHW